MSDRTPSSCRFAQRSARGVLIRGATRSDKTTTAVKRLEFATGFWLRQCSVLTEPIRVLGLTYNRSLRGYVEELVRRYIAHASRRSLSLETFVRWAALETDRVGVVTFLDPQPPATAPPTAVSTKPLPPLRVGAAAGCQFAVPRHRPLA
ncbi:MAG: hypothetical protein JWR63_993 [Conexibacter sp.]|nr:hypothetical protein [Conexibacter sp.]